MSKETWLIEPRDAFIARDGRPFGTTAGIRAKSLDFPFPSTTTGGVRTRSGLIQIGGDLPKFDRSLVEEVLNIEVKGPLLAEIEGEAVKMLVHAPADCRLIKSDSENSLTLSQLVPLEKGSDGDFESNLDDDLHLIGTTQRINGKPQYGPRFWYWSQFEKWLDQTIKSEPQDIEAIGHDGPTSEQRTHVRILDERTAYQTKASSDGGLFQTRGLEFIRRNSKAPLSSSKYLGLLVEIDRQSHGGELYEGIAPLGGERRMVFWRRSNLNFPTCPPAIRARIMMDKACRLILLTPAIFEDGFKPSWIKVANHVSLTVEAFALSRAQVISGWDFAQRQPKPTRRMCPAGTVLFLKLSGGDIGKWIDETWFHCISDDAQDRKDGFGLAALGTWTGEFLKVEEALTDEKN